MYGVRLAGAADLRRLPEVEAAADEVFAPLGITDLPPPASAEERARAWRVTLITYADVPWNAPFYRRHGWAESADLSPALRLLREHEQALGLDDHGRRVVMARPV